MPTTRSSSSGVALRDLLRRLAALAPGEATKVVRTCARDSPRDVQKCLSEYGAMPGLLRLTQLFPDGYLDDSPDHANTKTWSHGELARLRLVQCMDRMLPQLSRPQQTSISSARLDDFVFRDVLDRSGSNGDRIDKFPLRELSKLYEVAPRMNRLQELVDSLRDEVDLSDAVLVAHQHLLGSVASQFSALRQLGLAPRRTYIVGKPYSTNRLVAAHLSAQGYSVRSGFEAFDREARDAPDWYQADRYDALGYFFARVVRSLPQENVRRLIVLDDGGLILSWLNRAFDSDLFTQAEMSDLGRLEVVGVEQTTFGRRLVGSLDSSKQTQPRHMTRVPVANVAQTRLKLEKECELIAQSVVNELREWIRSSHARGEHADNLSDARIGVVGFGVVGAWICRALQREELKHQILVFDESVSHSSIARSFGYRVASSASALAAECSVIIGCTGARDGIAIDADALRPGTILASASSGNYEFARAFITARKPRVSRINPEVNRARRASSFDWLHSIVAVPVKGGNAYVLNSGFPINFTGGVDPIRPEQIELTRCLMVLGVAAALRELPRRPNFGGTVQLAAIDETPLKDLLGHS